MPALDAAAPFWSIVRAVNAGTYDDVRESPAYQWFCDAVSRQDTFYIPEADMFPMPSPPRSVDALPSGVCRNHASRAYWFENADALFWAAETMAAECMAAESMAAESMAAESMAAESMAADEIGRASEVAACVRRMRNAVLANEAAAALSGITLACSSPPGRAS